MDAFLGDWYEIKRDKNSPGQNGQKCDTASFSYIENDEDWNINVENRSFDP